MTAKVVLISSSSECQRWVALTSWLVVKGQYQPYINTVNNIIWFIGLYFVDSKWLYSTILLLWYLQHFDVRCWDSVMCCTRSCVSPGVQCGLPESGSEGRAGRGSEAAGVQPNWQHHLLRLPVHHQRPVWVWQAHVHRSARLPGRKGSRFHLLHGLFWEQACHWLSCSWDQRPSLDLIKWKGNVVCAEKTTFEVLPVCCVPRSCWWIKK